MGKKAYNIKISALIVDLINEKCTYAKFNPDHIGLIKGF